MLSKPQRWAALPYDTATARRLADGLGVSGVVGAILARRGFHEVEEARRFLDAAERHDPLALPGVAQACELIRSHVGRGSRIAVFGDYDVDGVCATAMLVRTLRALGADPIWELPSRFDEGYGLSPTAVERLAARGAALLVTVDCGITALEPVAVARKLGLDVLITDHHRPGPELPDCPIVHPSASDAPAHYPADLCAAGVVLKLSEALRGEAEAADDLDLAALATVCDLVPLVGENRRIVREGLRALSRTQKPGLRALMDVAGVDAGAVTEHCFGFRLGPRINAAGRMGHADAALELLLTHDGARAAEVARELDLLNRDRRETETRILFAADAACAPQASQAAIVVAGEGWHPGVVGIVASRLVERWRRPTLVIALGEDGGRGRGSGRSIPAYDLHGGLAACAEHLDRFGGHRMAAGVELRADAVDPFRRALAAHAAEALCPDDLIAVERVEAVVPGGALGLDLAEELERLRPFGMGNPQPTLLVPAARVENVAAMGEERQHARFTVVTGAARARGVSFGTTRAALEAGVCDPCHVAARLERNRWNGVVEPRLALRAVCPSPRGEIEVLGEDGSFWERLEEELRGEPALVQVAPAGALVDRRGEGFAGVAGDLISSGEQVLIAVADVERRREALEERIAGLRQAGQAPPGSAFASTSADAVAGQGVPSGASGPSAEARPAADSTSGPGARSRGALPVIAWSALARRPELAAAFDHLVALDPPPGAFRDPLLRVARTGHAAWGPAEVEFALGVWRAELELRPALTDAFRALRDLQEAGPPDREAGAAALERALRGSGRYPRSPEHCARLVRVLTELGLIELSLEHRTCRIVEGVRSDLELSPAFRAYRARFAEIEAALGHELPARVDVRPAQAG